MESHFLVLRLVLHYFINTFNSPHRLTIITTLAESLTSSTSIFYDRNYSTFRLIDEIILENHCISTSVALLINIRKRIMIMCSTICR